MTNDNKTQEERLLAGLAHALIITGAIGPVAALVIYLVQREKSLYASRQALQACIYQLIGVLATICVWSCWGVFYALSFIPIIADAEQYSDAPPPIFWVGLGSMIVPFIFMGLWGLYGLYGGVRAWQGANFQYLIIGPLVEKQTMTKD